MDICDNTCPSFFGAGHVRDEEGWACKRRDKDNKDGHSVECVDSGDIHGKRGVICNILVEVRIFKLGIVFKPVNSDMEIFLGIEGVGVIRGVHEAYFGVFEGGIEPFKKIFDIVGTPRESGAEVFVVGIIKIVVIVIAVVIFFRFDKIIEGVDSVFKIIEGVRGSGEGEDEVVGDFVLWFCGIGLEEFDSFRIFFERVVGGCEGFKKFVREFRVVIDVVEFVFEGCNGVRGT